MKTDSPAEFAAGGDLSRTIARHEPGVVWPWMNWTWHDGRRVAAAGRTGCAIRYGTMRCGFAVWTPPAIRLGLTGRSLVISSDGYEAIPSAKPFENSVLLLEGRCRISYERLRSSYDENFYRRGGAGRLPGTWGAGWCIPRFIARGEYKADVLVDPGSYVGLGADFNVDPMYW